MMSISRQHNLWLSLVDVTGAFLSLPVLQRAFPNGLDVHEPEQFRDLKMAFEQWLSNAAERRPDVSIHRAFCESVLGKCLGFPRELLLSGQSIPNSLRVEQREHNEILQPDFVLITPSGKEDGGKPRLLIQILPISQGIEKPLTGSRWVASPATRMQDLLLATGVELGLITNGKRWTLVRAKHDETTTLVSWETEIWFEEKITLQAFRSLLRLGRFFGVSAKDTLESLIAESKHNQQELTDKLGSQVRQAIEVLMRSFETIDKERGFLAGVSDREIYEAALTVMMRLVVLLCVEDAEEDLFGVKNSEVYQQFYSITTLHSQLDETARNHGEEILERKFDAWARLMATFRAIHTGVNHDLLHLMAHGGDLFSPDKYPFLEGRDRYTDWLSTGVKPLPVDNRVVFHLLTSLQFIQERSAHGETEARRVSFRSLNVERIGNIYESLLDHTARRATTDLIELDSKEQPIVSIDELETVRSKGEDALVDFLKEKTKRSPNAIKKAISSMDDLLTQDQHELGKLRTACHNNEALYERMLPFFGLIRRDTRDYPIVILNGSLYVASGEDRRSTGTHYTPPNFTSEIVKHTLDPLVYDGLADGKPVEEWRLKSPKEILDLKICDIACGSGAFLVQVCRYLGEKLVQSWDNIEAENTGKIIVAPDGTLSEAELSERLIPSEPKERLLTAKRYVADRCLYGVDRNPVAVEMAKISVWLETMQKNKPFTFLDHNIRSGDSLLGVTDLRQLEDFSLDEANTQIRIIGALVRPLLEDAIAKRKRLEDLPSDTPQQIELKEHFLRESKDATDKVRFLADLLIGEALQTAGKKKKKYSTRGAKHAEELHEEEREDATAEHDNLESLVTEVLQEWQTNHWNENIQIEDLRFRASNLLGDRKPFHWLLEFPEVFAGTVDNGQRTTNQEPIFGFDAIVSNPPFMGGKKIRGNLGEDYRDFMIEFLAGGIRGNADLAAYFFLRVVTLADAAGLLATNTIAEGDSREVGLDQIEIKGTTIYRAISSRKWEGTASLEVSFVWLRNSKHWNADKFLDGKKVTGITPLLNEQSRISGKPSRLKLNEDKSFMGSYVLGMGFVLTPEEAHTLITKDKRNREVLFPYLNGEDLNSRSDQSASRWVINFFDYPLERTADGVWSDSDPSEQKTWLQIGYVPKDYPFPVARDFPDCISIIEEKVKPERIRTKKTATGENVFTLRYPLPQKWWIYADKRPQLYSIIGKLNRVIVRAQVSKFHVPVFANTYQVFSNMCVVFPFETWTSFTQMQSSIHENWVSEYSSKLETRGRYTPSDCFETFPFLESLNGLEQIGEQYHQHRREIMSNRQEGLTQTYNRFHSPSENSEDIVLLRELHVEMDEGVKQAYGWDDLTLDHGFHETKQGIRFTISPEARQEVLDRLLELNHERYAEEVVQGLHEKGSKKKTAKKKSSDTSANNEGPGKQGSLGFMPEQDDLF